MPIVRGIANCDRQIVVFDKRENDKDKVKIVVNGKQAKAPLDVFQEWRSKLNYDASFPVLIRRENNKQTLKEFYDEIIIIADTLKEKTSGIINMYITGRFSKTALQYYFTQCFNKLNLTVDPIKYDEAIWIDKASQGSLMYAQSCKNIKAYSYDFVSFYPSIMKDNKMLFPIKQGEFKTLTETEFNTLTFFQYGIFRAKVFRSDSININKLFRFNSDNHYTHIDLTRAKDLGLQIKLIFDDEPNFLYYKRESLVSGKVLFGSYVDYFYQLKKEKVPGAKNLINVLWGALSEQNVIKVKFDINEGLTLHDDKDAILYEKIEGTSQMIAHVVNTNSYFEYDLARIKPFLLAKGRKKIGETVQPYISNLIYTHTDSAIFNTKVNLKTGTDIGQLKYEGYCKDFWCDNINHKTPKDNFKI